MNFTSVGRVGDTASDKVAIDWDIFEKPASVTSITFRRLLEKLSSWWIYRDIFSPSKTFTFKVACAINFTLKMEEGKKLKLLTAT